MLVNKSSLTPLIFVSSEFKKRKKKHSHRPNSYKMSPLETCTCLMKIAIVDTSYIGNFNAILFAKQNEDQQTEPAPFLLLKLNCKRLMCQQLSLIPRNGSGHSLC